MKLDRKLIRFCGSLIFPLPFGRQWKKPSRRTLKFFLFFRVESNMTFVCQQKASDIIKIWSFLPHHRWNVERPAPTRKKSFGRANKGWEKMKDFSLPRFMAFKNIYDDVCSCSFVVVLNAPSSQYVHKFLLQCWRSLRKTVKKIDKLTKEGKKVFAMYLQNFRRISDRKLMKC